jgi:hypothetical protein
MRILLLMLFCPLLLAAQQPGPGTASPDDKPRLDAIARARTTLGEELKVAEDTLSLVSAKASTWPDASLGCPEKGHMYAQMITDGWTVVLEHDGTRHEVHVAGRKAVICPGRPDKK